MGRSTLIPIGDMHYSPILMKIANDPIKLKKFMSEAHKIKVVF